SADDEPVCRADAAAIPPASKCVSLLLNSATSRPSGYTGQAPATVNDLGWESCHPSQLAMRPLHMALSWAARKALEGSLGFAVGGRAAAGMGFVVAGRHGRPDPEQNEPVPQGEVSSSNTAKIKEDYPKGWQNTARWIKARLQMAIGLYALGWLAWSFYL